MMETPDVPLVGENDVDERRNSTICWDCQRAVGKDRCCWADNFKPVKGWNAIRNDLKSTPNGGLVISYIVLCCPLFVPDEPLNGQPVQQYKRFCGKKPGR